MLVGRHIAERGARALGLTIALAAAFVGGVNGWVRLRTGAASHAEIASIPASSVIIVPGSTTSRGKAKATLETRLQGALALFRAGRAPRILVSGIETARDPEISAMTSWLEERGVPHDRILVDSEGTRTRATMYRATKLYDVERAIVCTETLHMPRTLFLANDYGIDAVGFALPTTLTRSPKIVATELLKTTLAFVESIVPTQVDASSRAVYASTR